MRRRELKDKIEEYKTKYMIYSENLEDETSESTEQQVEGKPITISSIGESLDSVRSLHSSMGKEEKEAIIKSSFWMPMETERMSEEQINTLLKEPDIY